MFRILNILMFAVFILAVVVQYNDPDALVWIGLYGYAAVMCALAIARKYTLLPVLGAVVYIPGFFYMMPLEWEGSLVNVEEAREAFGLLICGVWMIVLTAKYFRERNNVKTAADEGRPQAD